MKRADFVLSPIIALVALQSYYVWLDKGAIDALRLAALSQDQRPFVYRALLPILSRALAWATHLDVVICIVALYIASAVGMYFAFKYLYEAFFTEDRSSVMSFAFCMVVFLVTVMATHVYDLTTVAFFCLSTALIVRGKHTAYMIIFPLVSLNRETSFLLVLFWIVYEFRRIPTLQWLAGMVYQTVAWIAVRAITMSVFAGHPGSVMYWRPGENLAGFIATPVKTMVLAASFGIILWLVFQNWKVKPVSLRTAFLTMLPVLLLMHFLAGNPYEIRVYAESLPFVFLLATWRVV